MKYNKDAFEFWRKNKKVVHIIPPNSKTDFPEGWDVPTFLKHVVQDESIVEFGCGYGRLIDKFDPQQYKGFDLNPSAVAKAMKLHPNYNFFVYEIGDKLPPSAWVMAYTVLLHVSDDDIDDILDTITANCSKVIISEIMERRARRPLRAGKPPVWNREKEDYVALMKARGFHLTNTYSKAWRDVKDRLTILVFER